MMRTIYIRYGIGYGEHETEIEVPEDADEHEVNLEVHEAIMERVWYSVVEQEDEA